MRRVGEVLMVCSWGWISDSLDFGRDGRGAFSRCVEALQRCFFARGFFVFSESGNLRSRRVWHQ